MLTKIKQHEKKIVFKKLKSTMIKDNTVGQSV